MADAIDADRAAARALLPESSDHWCGCWEGDLHDVFDDTMEKTVEAIATALADTHTRAAAEAMERAACWLVERNVNGYPEWVAKLDAYSDDCVVTWTRNAVASIRFQRQQDAAAILPVLGGRYGQVRCTEHLFISASAIRTTTPPGGG